jgi:glutamate-1-semialdehyde 2,1-aminomutase
MIPGGVNSPVRAFRELDMLPMIVERGCGDLIEDVDGHSYIDYCMSWGALMLGHAHPKIVNAVRMQVEQGSSFGIATRIENDLAEKVLSHMPSMEKIRFVSSGTEATMSAIRLARGVTGKHVIVKFNGNYHGHVDSLLIQAGSGVSYLPQASSKGIPKEMVQHTVSLPYNDIPSLQRFFGNNQDVAAVILEPMAANMGFVKASSEFLYALREETQKAETLLIFDEVVTGFRLGLAGAQGYYGIVPDLTCLGKIIGGGFPAAAFGGKRQVMDALAPLGSVYQAGTLSGNPVAMRAGFETLKELEKPDFYSHLQKKADRFFGPIEEWIRKKGKHVCLNREGSMFTLFFGVSKVERKEDLSGIDLAKFKDFFQFLFHQGIYLSPSQFETSFLSEAHTEEHLEKTQASMLEFLMRYCS